MNEVDSKELYHTFPFLDLSEKCRFDHYLIKFHEQDFRTKRRTTNPGLVTRLQSQPEKKSRNFSFKLFDTSRERVNSKLLSAAARPQRRRCGAYLTHSVGRQFVPNSKGGKTETIAQIPFCRWYCTDHKTLRALVPPSTEQVGKMCVVSCSAGSFFSRNANPRKKTR